MVSMAMISADAPWAYVRCSLPIFSPTVTTIRFQPIMVPQSERERDGEFHPYRNVLGLLLKSRLVGGQRFRLGRIRDLMLLQKLADRFAG